MYLVVTCATPDCPNPAEVFVEDGEDQADFFDAPALCDGCMDALQEAQRAEYGRFGDYA